MLSNLFPLLIAGEIHAKTCFLPRGNIGITLDKGLIVMGIEGPCNVEFFEPMPEKLTSLRAKLIPITILL